MTKTRNLADLGGGFIQAGTGAVQRTVESKLQDVVSVKDFGAVGDGVTDDTAAIQAAFTASKTILFPPGTYNVSTDINIQAGTSIVGIGYPTIKDISITGDESRGLLSFRGVGESTSSAITGDLALGDRTVNVSNSTGFAIGDFVYILTDEIFMGITGLSGFEPKSKGEMSSIRAVSGTTITLEEPLKDAYTVAGSTLRLVKVTNAQGLSIKGLNFIGKGGGNTHTSSVPQSISAIYTRYAADVLIEDCSFSNFARFGISADRTNNLTITNCRFLGRKLTDPTNQGSISDWFTGAHAKSCQNIVFDSNYCEHSRRNFDADCDYTRDVSPVCRNIVISNNTSINCLNVVGTHICENVSITGNVGYNAKYQCLQFRGKNVTISNNFFEGSLESNELVRVGPIGNETVIYGDTNDAGAVSITSNTLKQATGAATSGVGISINIEAKDVNIASNIIDSVKRRGILLLARSLDSVSIVGNTIRMSNSDNADDSGICVKNTNTRLKLKRLIISSNTIIGTGTWGKGIHLVGTSDPNNPLNNVEIIGNTFTGLYQNIYTGASGAGDVQGYWGSNVVVSNNIFGINSQGAVDVIDSRLSGSPLIKISHNTHSTHGAGFVDMRIGTNPADRSWERGMITLESEPSAGGFIGSVAVLPGSRGTLNGGATTGDITAGTNILDVNSLTGLVVGCYINVSGAGISRVKVVSVDVANSRVTLASNASSTVTGAAVSYQSPTFKTFGAISA